MAATTTFLAHLYRHGIAIGALGFGLFAFLLVQCIAGVIRTGRQARLFSVPLVERQEVTFAEAGRVVLAMEGPLLSRRFAGLEYELVGPDGAKAPQRSALFRARTTGFSKARLELKVFEVRVPGRYVFRILGLAGAQLGDAEHRMVFTRPHLATSLAYVVGIVLSAGLAIASVVLFFLRLANLPAD